MAEIRWTEESYRWLRDIHDYIAADNPTAAKRVVEEIRDKVRLLAKFPEIGHKWRGDPDGDIRVLLYGHYRIAYRIGKMNTIDILGIFHGALEISRYLK